MERKTIKSAVRFSQEKMAKNNLFATERLCVDVYCLEPGQAQKLHAHEAEDKAYVVLDGKVNVTVAGEECVLGAGDAVLARAASEHGVRNDSTGLVILLVVMAPPPPHVARAEGPIDGPRRQA